MTINCKQFVYNYRSKHKFVIEILNYFFLFNYLSGFYKN